MIDKFIEKIVAETDLSKEEVLEKVEKKIQDLDGLISKEGAIYIIANSLGVELNKSAMISNKLEPGMRNININLRVLNAYDTIEFNKTENKGKVRSLWCANSTIRSRVVMWNEAIDQVPELKEGDVIAIQNAYTKENRNGAVEIHCTNYSTLSITQDQNIPPLEELKSAAADYEEVELKQIKESNKRVEVKGFILNIFPVRYFEVCPECNRRVRPVQDQYNCETHGVVNPVHGYVTTAIVDDGTETIRATFFREAVCNLTEKTNTQLLNLKDDPDALGFELDQIKGDFVTLKGMTKHNSFSNQIELNVNQISKKVDLDAEIEGIKEKIRKLE